ncbi:MAG: 30S ribosomal protein S30e [Thermoprotei archaeon]|nr:30S ribosomal protein S30e [Thermoprotei archaeon]
MPSHGSLTKAGKVRSQTPKIPPKPKKNLIPRRRNLRNFKRRVVYPTMGKPWPILRLMSPKKWAV